MVAPVVVPGVLHPDGTLRLDETPKLPPGPVVVTVAASNDIGMSARERFEKLAGSWKANTRFLSNVTTKALDPDYQKIIGMGKEAIPFILNDLVENGPNDWFWALTAITDVNPIKAEFAGNMVAMSEAWLQWGTQAGYLSDFPKTTNKSSQT